jgi:hypothetical protein
VSAKYAAIGRAAAAETAAAQEAARREQQRQQQLRQEARRAAAAALQVETDSEHEVDVIIITSPKKGKGGNARSSLRSSAGAACAAAIAARAAALRNSTSSSPARVQYLPETAMAVKPSTGSSKSISTNFCASDNSSAKTGSNKLPKSLRDLINKQKQHAPAHDKHGKPAAALRLQNNCAAANSIKARASRQDADTYSRRDGPAKGSNKLQPGKPQADTRTAAACAAAATDQQACSVVLSELAAAAGQGAAAARSTRQALLAKLLEEWSDADLVRLYNCQQLPQRASQKLPLSLFPSL